MLFLFSVMFGAIFGIVIGGIWLGLDLIVGTQTITENKFAGVVLLCACATPLSVGALILIEEWRT